MTLSKSALVLSIATSLVLSGCVSNTSSTDPRLNDKDFEVQSESAATACVVGAAATGMICLLAVDGDARAACLAAAAVGCGIGLGGNALLDSLRKNYHTREQQLDAFIKAMSDNNAKARKLAQVSTQVYKDDLKEFKSLEKKIAQKKVQKKELSSTISRYDDTIKLLTENIEQHQKALEGYHNARNGLSSGDLTSSERAKLRECDKRIAELERDIELIRETRTAYIENRDVLNLASNNLGGNVAS